MSLARSRLTRRTLIGTIASTVILPGELLGGTVDRFAVVDWALLETVLSLGLVPLAAPELVLYERLAVEPHVPDRVVDLGLRGALSFERLALIAPDVVYGSNYSAWTAPQIEPIAPLKIFDLFQPGEPPLAKIETMTVAIADDFGIAATGRSVVADAHKTLKRQRDRLTAAGAQDVILVDIGDSHHVRVYGNDSLFGETLTRLGLANAWKAGTRYSASAPVGMEALAAYPDAFLLVVGPVPPDAELAVRNGALWHALPAVVTGRFALLPSCNAFGGLPAAVRFARFVSEALLSKSDLASP